MSNLTNEEDARATCLLSEQTTRGVVFTNKRTVDAVKRMENPEHVSTRDKTANVPAAMLTPQAELEALRLIYMECAYRAPASKSYLEKGVPLIKKEVASKRSGYAAQDKKKGIFDADSVISADECVAKLISCNLNCWYCKKGTKILYSTVRDPSQWSLDRLNNDLGHTDDNTVVSCLECNLKRRRQSADKFKLGKSIVVKRS